MTRRMIQWATALAVAAALSGCSQTARYVTTKTWFGNDELFVATSEVTGNILTKSWTAKVRSCHRSADNALTCVDQAEVNKFLNADNNLK